MIADRKVPLVVVLFHLLLLSNLLSLCDGFSTPLTTKSVRTMTATTATKKAPEIRRKYRPRSTITGLKLASVATTTATTTIAKPPPKKPDAKYDSIVVGGGPAGLLSAIMLTRLYGPSHRIAVLERRTTPPPDPTDSTIWNSDVARFYLLGIGFRGQDALREFGVFDDFEKVSVAVNGRYDWQPGMKKREEGNIVPARKDVVSRVLPRDKLVGVLHKHLLDNYSDSNIDMLYGYECQPIGFGETDDDVVTVRIVRCGEAVDESKDDNSSANETASGTNYVPSQESAELCDVEYLQITRTNLLIAADGSARTVANAIEAHDRKTIASLPLHRRLFGPSPFRVKRYEDDNVKVYKSVRIQLPSDYPHDLNYSSRQSRINLEALPSDADGTLCALLLMNPNEPFAKPNADPVALRKYFDEQLPLFSKLIPKEEMETLAKKPPSSLPRFRYVGPKLNCEARTVVLGDAAHTVKPYYGLGANSALEDVKVLGQCLKEASQEGGEVTHVEKTIPKAVRTFSDRRAEDSAALVTMSRNMDRPGKLFFACFLLPLILDGIFHKLAPKVFGPNMFAMFQRKDLTFRDIRRKKRLDRAMQVGILGVGLGCLGVGVTKGLGLLLRVGMGWWKARGLV